MTLAGVGLDLLDKVLKQRKQTSLVGGARDRIEGSQGDVPEIKGRDKICVKGKIRNGSRACCGGCRSNGSQYNATDVVVLLLTTVVLVTSAGATKACRNYY